MGPTLQKKMIALFHYALNPDGFLFLGTSETIGGMSSLFTVLDRKQKLYQRANHSYMAKNVSATCLRRPLQPLSRVAKRPCDTIFRCKNWLKKALTATGGSSRCFSKP